MRKAVRSISASLPRTAPWTTQPCPTVAPAPVAVHAAARSRAHGPTAALWHAVEVHRPTLDDVFLTKTGRSLRD